MICSELQWIFCFEVVSRFAAVFFPKLCPAVLGVMHQNSLLTWYKQTASTGNKLTSVQGWANSYTGLHHYVDFYFAFTFIPTFSSKRELYSASLAARDPRPCRVHMKAGKRTKRDIQVCGSLKGTSNTSWLLWPPLLPYSCRDCGALCGLCACQEMSSRDAVGLRVGLRHPSLAGSGVYLGQQGCRERVTHPRIHAHSPFLPLSQLWFGHQPFRN